MVSTLKSLGIESFIVMTPYQPIIFSDENEPASIKDHIRIEETLIIDTALKFNIPYYGSFDPKKVGCLPEDFHDDKHPKISCLNKIYFSSATPDENNSGIARQTLNEELDWRLDLSASGIKYVKISFDQLALPPSGH
ncbi:hypothetical protein [Cohnella sp. GCM10027633]|uniref:hypothetical protein n=1 Tax=unclassified Cohnella TaxID=2636738 RepID=UPI00363B4A75